MEHLAALGTDIGQNAIPTFKTYGPLLGAAAPTFFKPQTYRYSSDESITRHELDVYLPEPEAQGKNPVMVFVHGGGLVKGDKQMPFPGAHQNVGTFFAKRGYITVIPNYRLRLPDSPESPNNARFPSGGADIALVISWLQSSSCPIVSHIDTSQIFLIGNSAGAIHIATYLFSDAFPAVSLPGEDLSPLTPSASQAIKASILVSIPASFETAAKAREGITFGYFGGKEEVVAQRCPTGLRKRSNFRGKVLVMTAELDPEDEILSPSRGFTSIFEESPELASTLTQMHISGHNHISPPLGLGLGGKEEQWGEDVVKWCREQ